MIKTDYVLKKMYKFQNIRPAGHLKILIYIIFRSHLITLYRTQSSVYAHWIAPRHYFNLIIRNFWVSYPHSVFLLSFTKNKMNQPFDCPKFVVVKCRLANGCARAIKSFVSNDEHLVGSSLPELKYIWMINYNSLD